MASLTPRRSLVLVLIGTALAASACFGSLGPAEEGSGVPETTTYDLDGFDRVSIGSSFEADITVVDGPPSIEITVDDNFVDDLVVEVDGDWLEVGFDWGDYEPRVTPTAIISLPSLTEVDASGASEVEVDGFEAAEAVVDASGASLVTINGLISDSTTIDASGASDVVIAGVETGEVDLDASGAADIELIGEAGDVRLDGSGASDFDLSGLTSTSVLVELSGASAASIGSTERVDGDLSGASQLSAPSGAIGSIDTSGASGINLS